MYPIEHMYIAIFQDALGVRAKDPYSFDHSLVSFPWMETHRGKDPLDWFNPDVLVDYCHQLGLDVYNEGFYADKAVRVADDNLLERIKKVTDTPTYESAQKRLGIDSLVIAEEL